MKLETLKVRVYTVTDIQKAKHRRTTSPTLPHFYQFPKWFKGQVAKKAQMKGREASATELYKICRRIFWRRNRIISRTVWRLPVTPPTATPKLSSPSPSSPSFCERYLVSLSASTDIHNLNIIPRQQVTHFGLHSAQGTWVI
jgi:hypothetical protein